MPQTKFVLSKALAQGLKPIVIMNKVDRDTAVPNEVEDKIFDLFDLLGCVARCLQTKHQKNKKKREKKKGEKKRSPLHPSVANPRRLALRKWGTHTHPVTPDMAPDRHSLVHQPPAHPEIRWPRVSHLMDKEKVQRCTVRYFWIHVQLSSPF